MKGKKILKISLAMVASLLALLLIVFFFFLGPTVKLIAQTIGTKALGAPLTVEKLSINPRKGTIHLVDFRVANHDIFGQSNAVSLASLDIAVDMSSLFSSTVVVHRVDINSPHLVYEQSDVSDNISEFILNIQEFAGIDPSAPPPPRNPEKAEKERRKREKKARKKASSPAKVVVVEALAINDVELSFVSTRDEQLNFGAGFERFEISMTNGAVRLDNLFVSNPGRLETEHLFHLDQATLEMVPDSIYSSNITINAVSVKNPHIFVEHNPETDTIGEFLKIASGLATKIPTNAPKTAATNDLFLAEATPPPPPPPNVALESFVLDDFRLNILNTAEPELNMTIGLEHVNIALEQGDFELENLYVGNPKSLRTPYLFLLERIAARISPGSHLEDTLIIEDVQVTKPHVTLELHDNANTVSELLKIAKSYTDRVPTYPLPKLPPPPPPVEDENETEAPIKPPVELHNFAVDDIQARLLNTTATNHPVSEPKTLFGVREIALDFFKGELGVNDITIPNVAGFRSTNLFHIASIDVKVQPDSINTPQFLIEEVFIDSPMVNLEQTEVSGNVAELQTTLMKFTPDPSELPTLPAPTTPPATELSDAAVTNSFIPIAEQPVILNQLLVTNLAVNMLFPVDTNDTEQAWYGGMDLGKLNPLGGDEEEPEVDPDSAITLIAFDLLSAEPLKGMLQIDNLRVSNPPHFSRRNLVELERFRIDLDPDTIQTDTLLIEDVLLSGPRVRYERHVKTDNIQALQAEIERAATRRQGVMEEKAPEPEQLAAASTNNTEVASAEEGGQKVVIEHILIDDIIVRAKLSIAPAIPTPPFSLEREGLGKEAGGTTLADAGTEVFSWLYDGIIGAVGNATGLAGDTLKGAGSLTMDAFGNVFGGLTEGMGNVAKEVKEGTEEVVEEVKKKRKRGPAGGRRRSLFR